MLAACSPRRAVALFVLLAAVVLFALPGSTTEAAEIPSSMSALGDSITRGFNSCGFFFDCTNRSWSTGTYSTVKSHYQRILAKNPAISGKNYNDARRGAKMVDLAGQASTAASRGVQYVTILMGANDACTATEAEMTSAETFGAQFQHALDILLPASGSSVSYVFVASVPDAFRLWEVGYKNSSAVRAWNTYKVCQSMLANPTSTNSGDMARRTAVRDRIKAFNAKLKTICEAKGSRCKFDNEAVFAYPFSLNHLSTWDYFHPNTAGQTVLADVTYKAGFNW